ncbi:hypothetical protein ACQUW5_13840 [Legionella sp. CNM-1927-20]|uniref:hypothetical protein n=1 Tax=Legionella sp. CNM-1927-20 TaxID=3422221 RepID=UPI00403B153F
MSFSNTCPITFDNIDKGNSLLVKVPLSKKGEQDKLYYIKDENTLNQLHRCPFTKRTGEYFAVKLANLSEKELASLQVKDSPNELIEDNHSLIELCATFKWESRKFIPAADNHQYNTTSPADLALFTQGTNSSSTSISSNTSSFFNRDSSNHRFSFFAPVRPRQVEREIVAENEYAYSTRLSMS